MYICLQAWRPCPLTLRRSQMHHVTAPTNKKRWRSVCWPRVSEARTNWVSYACVKYFLNKCVNLYRWLSTKIKRVQKRTPWLTKHTAGYWSVAFIEMILLYSIGLLILIFVLILLTALCITLDDTR